MFHLELSNEEQELLTEILENSLPKLDIEIERTDGHDFKVLLKGRRDLLKRLLAKVSRVEAVHA